MTGYVEYDSNNSGGSWWLNDDQWRALEADGWEVDWHANRKDGDFLRPDKNGRWLGALAGKAMLRDVALPIAIARWESVTGEDPSAIGCNCCGNPHSFYSYDDTGNMTGSASPEMPTHGTMNIW